MAAAKSLRVDIGSAPFASCMANARRSRFMEPPVFACRRDSNTNCLATSRQAMGKWPAAGVACRFEGYRGLDVDDEIAGVQARGVHVLQEDTVVAVHRNQRVLATIRRFRRRNERRS